MSKELKFRAWNNKDKIWAVGSEVYLRLDGKSMAEIICDKLAVCGINNNVDIVIEQYTGLKDKNGKEIYEGDILQDSKGECCRVDWNEKEAHFGLYTNRQFELTDFIWMRGEDVEVIGNIHENPELLGGEE